MCCAPQFQQCLYLSDLNVTCCTFELPRQNTIKVTWFEGRKYPDRHRRTRGPSDREDTKDTRHGCQFPRTDYCCNLYTLYQQLIPDRSIYRCGTYSAKHIMTTTRSRMFYTRARSRPRSVLHPVKCVTPSGVCLRGYLLRYPSAPLCHRAPWRGSTDQAYSNSPIGGSSCQQPLHSCRPCSKGRNR